MSGPTGSGGAPSLDSTAQRHIFPVTLATSRPSRNPESPLISTFICRSPPPPARPRFVPSTRHRERSSSCDSLVCRPQVEASAAPCDHSSFATTVLSPSATTVLSPSATIAPYSKPSSSSAVALPRARNAVCAQPQRFCIENMELHQVGQHRLTYLSMSAVLICRFI
jgi:hypothetical protein